MINFYINKAASNTLKCNIAILLELSHELYLSKILKLKGYHCVYGYINTKDLIGPEYNARQTKTAGVILVINVYEFLFNVSKA